MLRASEQGARAARDSGRVPVPIELREYGQARGELRDERPEGLPGRDVARRDGPHACAVFVGRVSGRGETGS
jgi:hypothetical protein